MCKTSNLFITKAIIIIPLFLSVLSGGFAQSDNAVDEYSPAIEDNSLFVEEAYNQEVRVVQHISNAAYFRSPEHNIGYVFTQEWPLVGQAHQLSFTLPYAFLIGNTAHGLGDIMINYRYQLFTKADWLTMAPRLSIIIPSGGCVEGIWHGSNRT